MFNGNLTAFFLNEATKKEINLKFREVKFKEIIEHISLNKSLWYAWNSRGSCGAGVIHFEEKDNWKGHPANHPLIDFERFKKRFNNTSVKYIGIEPDKTTIYFHGC